MIIRDNNEDASHSNGFGLFDGNFNIFSDLLLYVVLLKVSSNKHLVTSSTLIPRSSAISS